MLSATHSSMELSVGHEAAKFGNMSSTDYIKSLIGFVGSPRGDQHHNQHHHHTLCFSESVDASPPNASSATMPCTPQMPPPPPPPPLGNATAPIPIGGLGPVTDVLWQHISDTISFPRVEQVWSSALADENNNNVNNQQQQQPPYGRTQRGSIQSLSLSPPLMPQFLPVDESGVAEQTWRSIPRPPTVVVVPSKEERRRVKRGSFSLSSFS